MRRSPPVLPAHLSLLCALRLAAAKQAKGEVGRASIPVKRDTKRRAKLWLEESMDVISKSVDFIERHLDEAPALDAVAAAAGVSRSYLARVFIACTGMTTLGYARARRLTRAATALANGAPDILTVALDAGYESHEAFSRAFRAQFGLSPQDLRTRGSLAGLRLQTRFSQSRGQIALDPPRIVEHAPLRLAGLMDRFSTAGAAEIAALWQRLGDPSKWRKAAFGACLSWDEEAETFDYLCAFAIDDPSEVPSGLQSFNFPAQTYATFWRQGDIHGVGESLTTIFGNWLPRSGRQLGAGPIFLLRFDHRFSSTTLSGFEISVPVVC